MSARCLRSFSRSVHWPLLCALAAISMALLGCGTETASDCDCASNTDEANAGDDAGGSVPTGSNAETSETAGDAELTDAANTELATTTDGADSSATLDGSETAASSGDSDAESEGTTTDSAVSLDAGMMTETAASDSSDETTSPSTPDASAPSPSVDAGTDECTCSDVEDPVDVCDCSDCEEALLVTTAFHVAEAPDYGDQAPAGGDHLTCWGAWGVHDAPLPAGNFVHNQEHGGVVFLYNCPDGCAEDVAGMQEFVEANELTILTEYSRMTARFAVASWGFRLESECLDMDAFSAFYVAHVDHAPEQFGRPPPPPPASCAE